MNKNISFWVACTLIFSTYAMMRVPFVAVPLDRDEGIFGYLGQIILDHGVPYRDVFEHKPPVVYYINAFALLLVPPTPTGIHLFLHAYNLMTTVALFFVAWTRFRSDSAALWTAGTYAVFSSTPGIQGFTASTEMFMLLPVALSLLFALLGAKRQMWFLPFMSGATGAIACWTKPTAAFSVLFIVIYTAVPMLMPGEGNRRRNLGRAIRTLAIWFAGGIGVSMVICGYFYSKGVFGEFIYWSFVHSYHYGKGMVLSVPLSKYCENLLRIFFENAPIFLTAIVGCILDLIRRDELGLFTLGFLVFSLLGTVPGFAYPHYFAQTAPAAAIAAGRGIVLILSAISGKIWKAAAVVAIATAVVTMPVVTALNLYLDRSPDRISRKVFGLNPFPESVFLGSYIASRTKPEDKVFIFGSEAQIYLYSQRKSATPFAMIYPLMSAFPRHREFQERAWAELHKRPPEYIVISNWQKSLMWDGIIDRAIYRNVMKLVREQYIFEGVMFIGGEKGLFVPTDQAASYHSGVYEHFLTVYRKRGKDKGSSSNRQWEVVQSKGCA